MKKAVVIALVLVAATFAGLQLFLAYGLTNSLRQRFLPMVRERWNINANLASASVNLLNGSLSIHDAHVDNPPGFDGGSMLTMQRFKLKIGVLALFRGGNAEITKAAIREGSVNIVRNREGVLNIEPTLASIHAAMTNAPTAPGGAEPADPGGGAPHFRRISDFLIRQMEIKTRLHYVDHKIGDPPLQLDLAIQMRLNNIANYGRDDVMSGTLNLLGQVLNTDRKCAFDLNGRIAPIKDPACLSFDLTGSIQTIDLKNFTGLAGRYGIQAGRISGTATLYCHHGVFNPDRSNLRLEFSQFKLAEKQQEQLGDIPFPESFKVLVPIQGTLTNPEIDIQQALMQILASPDTFDAIIKGALAGRAAAGKPADAPAGSNSPAGFRQPPEKSINKPETPNK